MSPRTRLAVVLALAAAVAGATGCGSNEINGQLTPDQASALIADLDAVQSAAEAGQCGSAASGADRFVLEVNNLPEEAGTELKKALRDAGTNLKTLAACEPSGATGAAGGQTGTTSRDTSSTTSTPTTTTESTTTTTTSEPEPPPSGGGNPHSGGNGNAGGNGQGNGNPGNGNAGGGGPSGGTGSGTGGTGVGGD